MSSELKDILSNLNKEIEQEKLLEYLNRRLSTDEQHMLESQMIQDEFTSDAMDGLQQMKNTEVVNATVAQLNANLKRELEKGKRKRPGKVMKDSWVYYAVMLLLLLVVVSYVVIRQLTR